MPHTHRTFSLAPAALALAAALAPTPAARADVRYTTQMQLGAPADVPADAMPAGMTMPGLRTTTYVKDMRERVETALSMGPFQSTTVALTLCDKHQTMQIDDALKLYTVAPIGVATFAPPQGGKGHAMPPGEAMPGAKPGVGHVTMTFSVADLGTEKVADLAARHLNLSVRTQTSGCLGTADQTMRLEEWIAPVKAGLNCPERFSPTRTLPNANGCLITYDMKGDWSRVRDFHGGMIVRQKTYIGDKLLATQDLRDYSEAALGDALFAPPVGYKQVSQAEFEKAQSDAMRKRIMGGLGQSMGLGDAVDAAKQSAVDAAKQSAADAANSAANAPADAADSAANDASTAASTAASDAAAAAAAAAKKKLRLPHFPF